MPDAITRTCMVTACGQPMPCREHTRPERQRQQARDAQRLTRHQRGYGARWDKFRVWHLNECMARRVPRAGLCGSRLPGTQNTQDSLCAQQGYMGPDAKAHTLDHIVPVTGPNDPSFFSRYAHQWLCKRCHDLKRQRESKPIPVKGIER
jgi:hypothetical protein